MYSETVLRLSRLVAQQAKDSVAGFASDFDAGIPPITRFESVDDVERIANNLELASGAGLTGTLIEMVGVFYELALNAVEHSQWAAGYYVIRACSSIVGGVEHTVGIADYGCREKFEWQPDNHFRWRLSEGGARRRDDQRQSGRIRAGRRYGGSGHHIRSDISDDDDDGQLVNAIGKNSAHYTPGGAGCGAGDAGCCWWWRNHTEHRLHSSYRRLVL